MSKRKPLSPAKWRTQYTPVCKDHHVERAWLGEHASYGAAVHQVAADALVDALKKPRTREEAHGLHLKLFAEYGNALELAGAWGWAMRTRREHKLLLDALLTYPPDAPRIFYRAAKLNRSGSLVRLLDLPSERRVLAALREVRPELEEDILRDVMADGVPHAKFLAARYLDFDEVIRSTYNRAKHGATMLHDESLHISEFWVISPNLLPWRQGRYLFSTMKLDRRNIERLRHGVDIAATFIGFMAQLAKALEHAEILYPGRNLPRAA